MLKELCLSKPQLSIITWGKMENVEYGHFQTKLQEALPISTVSEPISTHPWDLQRNDLHAHHHFKYATLEAEL